MGRILSQGTHVVSRSWKRQGRCFRTSRRNQIPANTCMGLCLTERKIIHGVVLSSCVRVNLLNSDRKLMQSPKPAHQHHSAELLQSPNWFPPFNSVLPQAKIIQSCLVEKCQINSIFWFKAV